MRIRCETEGSVLLRDLFLYQQKDQADDYGNASSDRPNDLTDSKTGPAVPQNIGQQEYNPVSYTHLRAHET